MDVGGSRKFRVSNRSLTASYPTGHVACCIRDLEYPRSTGLSNSTASGH